VQCAVLALPDVAELVRDQVVRQITSLQQDRAPERVADIAAKTREPEELGRDEDTDALDPNGLRIPVERVEACLCAQNRSLERRLHDGSAREADALRDLGAPEIRTAYFRR